MIALIERCYDAVVADGLAYQTAQPALTKARPRGPPPTPGRPQLLLPAQHAQSGRAPLPDRPERAVHQTISPSADGRMMKLRQKTPVASASEQGAAGTSPLSDPLIFDRQKRQGWDLLQTRSQPANRRT